jgi:lipopolysaccharide transport system ATP-binding protein
VSTDKAATPVGFWALKDVSFEVKQGEVLGIIGRNGAGKSTLLKILSRITEPTEGRVRIRGRVASLLEVGTGFHPELSGRENIYLNGAILGMGRAEIQKKFDEIVAFAEVEKFLDTAVKRYSSGMYVRLAFAVAAHLEPEVLIIDEVLAVGDAEFQKKCLGKMEAVSRHGRTVLFVTHNESAVRRLCTSAIVLESGSLISKGPVNEMLSTYRSRPNSTSIIRRGGHLLGIEMVDSAGTPITDIGMGEPFNFRASFITPQVQSHIAIIITGNGIPIMHLFDEDFVVEADRSEVCVEVAAGTVPLYPGWYYVDFVLLDRSSQVIDRAAKACEFQVYQTAFAQASITLTQQHALVHQVSSWKLSPIEL